MAERKLGKLQDGPFIAVNNLVSKHLQNVRRFQVLDKHGFLEAPNTPYDHHTVLGYHGAYGYANTRSGIENRIDKYDDVLTLPTLKQLWTDSLHSIEPPRNDDVARLLYRDREMLHGEMFFVDPEDVEAFRMVKQVDRLDAFFQESVEEHTRDLEEWLIRFNEEGVLPSGIDLDKSILYARVHDLGEAIGGDHAALKGKKTDDQTTREQQDFEILIKSEIGANITEECAQQLLQAYQEYEDQENLEAAVVKLIDRFCGSLRHIHVQLDLSLSDLEFSWGRVETTLQGLNKFVDEDCDIEKFRQYLMGYFLPSANWIRFYNEKPAAHDPPLIEF